MGLSGRPFLPRITIPTGQQIRRLCRRDSGHRRREKFCFMKLPFSFSSIMIVCTVVSNVEKPYKNYVVFNPSSNYTRSPGCVNYPAERMGELNAMKQRYFSDKSPDLHYGHPETHIIARISPYSYSALGWLAQI